jgi:hypothetical protein
MKECTDCKQTKSITDFRLPQSYCKPCANKRAHVRWQRTQLTRFFALFDKQEGQCAICHKQLERKLSRSLARDHNHQTGNKRGLLCNRCNIGLSYVEDLDFVEKAKSYLRDYDQ